MLYSRCVLTNSGSSAPPKLRTFASEWIWSNVAQRPQGRSRIAVWRISGLDPHNPHKSAHVRFSKCSWHYDQCPTSWPMIFCLIKQRMAFRVLFSNYACNRDQHGRFVMHGLWLCGRCGNSLLHVVLNERYGNEVSRIHKKYGYLSRHLVAVVPFFTLIDTQHRHDVQQLQP